MKNSIQKCTKHIQIREFIIFWDKIFVNKSRLSHRAGQYNKWPTVLLSMNVFQTESMCNTEMYPRNQKRLFKTKEP